MAILFIMIQLIDIARVKQQLNNRPNVPKIAWELANNSITKRSGIVWGIGNLKTQLWQNENGTTTSNAAKATSTETRNGQQLIVFNGPFDYLYEARWYVKPPETVLGRINPSFLKPPVVAKTNPRLRWYTYRPSNDSAWQAVDCNGWYYTKTSWGMDQDPQNLVVNINNTPNNSQCHSEAQTFSFNHDGLNINFRGLSIQGELHLIHQMDYFANGALGPETGTSNSFRKSGDLAPLVSLAITGDAAITLEERVFTDIPGCCPDP